MITEHFKLLNKSMRCGQKLWKQQVGPCVEIFFFWSNFCFQGSFDTQAQLLEIMFVFWCFSCYPLYASILFVLLPWGSPQVFYSTRGRRLSWDHIVVVRMLADFAFLLGLLVCYCLLWAPFVTDSQCWPARRKLHDEAATWPLLI